MMTGCGPARHGVFDHRYYDAAAGRLKVNHARTGPRPDLLAPALRLRPVGRLAEPAGDLSAARRSGGSSSRGWTPPTSTPRSRAPPRSPSGSAPRSPATTSGTLWKRPPRDLAEMAENARQTVEVFEAEAEAGLLADRMVPDWSALLVQFQNLDPFQHRAWRYLNVDETGHRRPGHERRRRLGDGRARPGHRPALRAGRPARGRA